MTNDYEQPMSLSCSDESRASPYAQRRARSVRDGNILMVSMDLPTDIHTGLSGPRGSPTQGAVPTTPCAKSIDAHRQGTIVLSDSYLATVRGDNTKGGKTTHEAKRTAARAWRARGNTTLWETATQSPHTGVGMAIDRVTRLAAHDHPRRKSGNGRRPNGSLVVPRTRHTTDE
jgi:hypothetical protein